MNHFFRLALMTVVVLLAVSVDGFFLAGSCRQAGSSCGGIFSAGCCEGLECRRSQCVPPAPKTPAPKTPAPITQAPIRTPEPTPAPTKRLPTPGPTTTPEPTSAPTYPPMIAGRVIQDTNDNGVADDGEGIQGVGVYIYKRQDCDHNPPSTVRDCDHSLASTVTDSNGSFEIALNEIVPGWDAVDQDQYLVVTDDVSNFASPNDSLYHHGTSNEMILSESVTLPTSDTAQLWNFLFFVSD